MSTYTYFCVRCGWSGRTYDFNSLNYPVCPDCGSVVDPEDDE